MAAVPPASTLDPEEVEKFSRLAHDWWNPDGPFAALHRLNPVRLRFIRERVRQQFAPGAGRKPFSGLSALDLGCGGGLISMPLARLGAKVLAVDASPDA